MTAVGATSVWVTPIRTDIEFLTIMNTSDLPSVRKAESHARIMGLLAETSLE